LVSFGSVLLIIILIGYGGILIHSNGHLGYSASKSEILLNTAKNLTSSLDPTLLKKANETIGYTSNGYTGDKKVVKGIDSLNKQLLVYLIESIYYSKENKVFFPFFPEDYHLGVVIPPSGSQIGDVLSLPDQRAFNSKAAQTEVIVFNGFNFTTNKAVGLDAAYRLITQEAINAIKSSPNNVIGPDPAG
jgi:hypothetical protein